VLFRSLAQETPNSFYSNQYHNQDNPEGHYLSTGPELWEQTKGQIDVFIAGLGTGGTITGTGRYLREKNPNIQLVGVDPVGSLYYEFVKSQRITKPFTYKVEGIGEDFFPSTFDPTILNDIIRVDDKECFLMARDLVRYEGLYVGGSSGAVVAGALKYAKKLDRPLNIVVLLPDSAAKYLSKIYNDAWMRDHGFLDDALGLGTVADLMKAREQKLVTTKATARVRDVIALLKTHGISQVPVVEDGHLRGAISEVELLRYLATGEHSLDSTVGGLVESEYATVSPDTKIELVQNLLADARMAMVIDGDTLIGVITKIDLIEYLAKGRGVGRSVLPPA
jgi:cystathionine beta-synthase